MLSLSVGIGSLPRLGIGVPGPGNIGGVPGAGVPTAEFQYLEEVPRGSRMPSGCSTDELVPQLLVRDPCVRLGTWAYYHLQQCSVGTWAFSKTESQSFEPVQDKLMTNWSDDTRQGKLCGPKAIPRNLKVAESVGLNHFRYEKFGSSQSTGLGQRCTWVLAVGGIEPA